MKHDLQILVVSVDTEFSSQIPFLVQTSQETFEPSQWDTATCKSSTGSYLLGRNLLLAGICYWPGSVVLARPRLLARPGSVVLARPESVVS